MTNNTGDTQEEGVYLNTVAEQIGRQFADRILARNLFVCTNNDGNPVRQMVDGIKEAVLYFHTNFNGCWNTRHPEPTGDRMAAIDLNNGVRERLETLVWAIEKLEPLFDVDIPNMPHGDSIGWQGDKEMKTTFGEVRALYEALKSVKTLLAGDGK